jgi:anaphase-promoting complex subunit 8
VEKFCPESCCVVGNHYSLKGKHERAVLYFQRAIKLNAR